MHKPCPSRARALLASAGLAILAQPGLAAADAGEPIVVRGARPAYAQARSATAVKTDTALRDTPQSVTVITRALIEDQAMSTMADVARYTPGVSMGQGEGHRDAPTVRGNSSTADFFVDSVRDDAQYFRDLYNAERVEVLKGPNAMIFGRGGGGGVINRVTKQADTLARRDLTLRAGSHEKRRLEIDAGGALDPRLSLRANAMYESAASYRDFVHLERYAANPSATLALSKATRATLSYEHLYDDRTVDRGAPSRDGRPVDVDPSTFFGNPAQSSSDLTVDLGAVTLEHAFDATVSLRNKTLFGRYDKFYSNVYAGSPVSAAGAVTLHSYYAGADRENVFNQTDLIWRTTAGPGAHTFLFGAEIGRQSTDNIRSATDTAAGAVTLAAPTRFTPVSFLPITTDNQVEVSVLAAYAQDQIALTRRLQLLAGLRFDRFEVDFDNALGSDFARTDDLLSPRLGLVVKPTAPVSLYASYSVSHLPQSGDQFGALTATTAALEPEKFENVELGAKWEIVPTVSLSAALYQLDRTNTTATDPATNRTVLTGAQRSEGFEIELAGALTRRWAIVAGYSAQEAKITETTAAAPSGRRVALTPDQTFSLWNKVRFTPAWAAGLGLAHQSESFASISNAVTLPAFTRVDAAIYYTLSARLGVQLNVQNLLDERYWGTAHNDNNITPGAPRAFEITLRTHF